MWQLWSCPAAMKSPLSAMLMVARVSVSWQCSSDALSRPPICSSCRKCCGDTAAQPRAPGSPATSLPQERSRAAPHHSIADPGFGRSSASSGDGEAAARVQPHGVEREGRPVQLGRARRHCGNGAPRHCPAHRWPRPLAVSPAHRCSAPSPQTPPTSGHAPAVSPAHQWSPAPLAISPAPFAYRPAPFAALSPRAPRGPTCAVPYRRTPQPRGCPHLPPGPARPRCSPERFIEVRVGGDNSVAPLLIVVPRHPRAAPVPRRSRAPPCRAQKAVSCSA